MRANTEYDDDIQAMNLSEVEKNGLQVYRNYQRAFEKDLRARFIAGVDKTPLDLKPLKEVMRLIAEDDIRFIPVIACAFTDELFKEMYKKFVPDGVPGGKGSFLGSYGPLSSLSSRIQHAFAFDFMHRDILLSLDTLRKHRNSISHKWNPKEFEDFVDSPLPGMNEAENVILPYLSKDNEHYEPSAEARMRMHTLWLLNRVFYEAHFYPLAKAAKLNPQRTLYQPEHPAVFKEMSLLTFEVTRAIINASR